MKFWSNSVFDDILSKVSRGSLNQVSFQPNRAFNVVQEQYDVLSLKDCNKI